MGNHKFRLSDMLPNAWFYKLKDMGTKRAKTHNKKLSLPPITTTTTTNTSPPPKPHHPRQSYHFPRDDSPPGPFHNNLAPTHVPDPPRKSSKNRRSTSKRTPKKSSSRLVTSSVSAACSCSRATIESIWTKPDSATEEYPKSSEIGSDHGSPSHTHTPCNCINPQNDVAPKAKSKKAKTLDLPQIITKKTESEQTKITSANGSMLVKVMKEDTVGISQKEQRTSPLRKYSTSSPGMKLRTNYPKIGTRKGQASHRKSLSTVPTTTRNDSFAVVKSSMDPQREFKESMVEMIIENNIKTSKELEELLACYLSLNSDEYHHIIIEVFKQIWFDTYGH